jgi:quinol monooxygenase YgiN
MERDVVMISKSKSALGALSIVLVALFGCGGSQETGEATAAPAPIQDEGDKMIIVEVDVTFGEGALDGEGVRDAFRAMEEQTRKEPGCIKYVSSVDIHDPSVVRIYEVWGSMDALVPHFKTQHMADFQEALGGIETKGMTAKVYEVSRELPFPNAR